MNDLDWEVTEVNKTCFFHLIQHADFGGTVYPNPWHQNQSLKNLPRCQSSGRTSNSNFTVRESFSTHSEPRSCLCDNPKIPWLGTNVGSIGGRWVFLFLKWYHSLPKSLPGKEKGNWITNTSFLKFEVCFEVEDHHGTDNTINISMGEAGSWISRCFKCFVNMDTKSSIGRRVGLLFTSAMLPTLVPRCPQSCWYTSWLVKKRVKRHQSDKACKTQTEMIQWCKKKRWGPKPSNFQKFRTSFWYSKLKRFVGSPEKSSLFPSQVTSGPKAQPQVSVVGWHLTSWKVMIKIQVNSAVEGKKFLDWLVWLFN